MAAPRQSRLDAFVDHLLKHDARELVLEGGKAALFRFRGGDRSANAVIAQAQLEAIVAEIAPDGAEEALRSGELVNFVHTSGAGATVKIEVVALDGGTWRASLKPHVAEAAIEPAEFDFGAPSQQFDFEPAPTRGRSRPPGGGRASRPPRAGSRTARAEPTLVIGSGAETPPTGAETRPRVEPRAAAARTAVEVPRAATARTTAEEPPRSVVAPVAGEPRVHGYLRKLVALGGSDLHLSAEEIPRCRVNGEVQLLDPRHPRITDAEMREMLFQVVTPRAREQFDACRDADFGLSIEGVARFRANFFEDRKGMGAVFRQIPFEILTPDQLGLPKAVLDLCWLSKGLVVVTGPTGSGKSTTLAALVDFVNRNRTDHIVTIEDPIEFVHENRKCLVNQREVGSHTESFKNALRAALREDPDIVLVGEMRDLETIAIAIETAETGHLVFGTLHTTTAASTVDRIIDQFPPDRQAQIRTMLSESLRGVIAQVLCRKQSGGRVAAYEVLLTNAAVSNLIRESKTYQLTTVMQTARGSGMQTMNDHLFELVKKKIVHPREAYIKSTDKSGLRELYKRDNIPLDLTGG